MRLRRHLRAFGRRTEGSGTVEMVFSVLALNMLLAAFFIWWGAYNSHALADRATYTINDLITRQRGVELQRSFLDGLERTAEYILDPDQDARVRFTQVTLVAGRSQPIRRPCRSTGPILPAPCCPPPWRGRASTWPLCP